MVSIILTIIGTIASIFTLRKMAYELFQKYRIHFYVEFLIFDKLDDDKHSIILLKVTNKGKYSIKESRIEFAAKFQFLPVQIPEYSYHEPANCHNIFKFIESGQSIIFRLEKSNTELDLIFENRYKIIRINGREKYPLKIVGISPKVGKLSY